MNWINPDQNLVGAVKQIQEILCGGVMPDSNDDKFSEQQCKDAFFYRTGSEKGAIEFHRYYGSQGWKKANGLAITNLDLQVANWINNPKREDDKDGFMEKVMKDVTDRDSRKNKGIMAVIDTRSNISTDEELF